MKKLAILLVIDEPIFSYGLQIQFQKWSFARVEIATDSEHGLQSLHKQAPSLIIIDEKFTNEQAYGTLELIAGFRSIPVILLSPHANPELAMPGSLRTDNPHTYLSKPCLIADLQAAVENLLHIHI